ncbi:Flp pilus assembly protein CpaB [Ramlibacter algicola]|uniref:Flp pilus assembly protein CpaB n=1 Tax=Ramlibacter algicola TaxID=2795217 RepID=A0A934Q4A7_9BURK|nr:Flp pilus assembly protein CpaB [Ramlibacter algicola]MBK0394004.1 Flp pilus assembly protein CpaB [Ramlibacter algicola]
MRNAKALVLLVLAVLFGLGAALYAARWVAQRGNLSSKVAVAAVDIELGSRINSQMVNLVDWPSGSMPPGAFSDLKALEDRVVKVGVLRGDAIVERKLAPVGTKGGLSAVIAEGKRAMTVRVNDVVGVAGFALPGNYVDVMVNMQQEHASNRQDSISRLVLEKVLVLAVAQEASRDDLKPKVVNAVTLELSPADAEKLDLARSVGTLSLVLRNQLDGAKLATAGVTRAQLLGMKEVVAKAPPAPAPRPRPAPAPAPRDCVEVIRNAASATQCF